MFVRRKTSRGGKVVHQLVTTSRVNGKVRQRVVAHLGDAETLVAAIADCETRLQKEYARVKEGLAGAEFVRIQLKEVGWQTIPEDYQEIRRRARYHWDMKPLRNAISQVLHAQERIKPLEQRLARLRQADTECSACNCHYVTKIAGTTDEKCHVDMTLVVPDQIDPSP